MSSCDPRGRRLDPPPPPPQLISTFSQSHTHRPLIRTSRGVARPAWPIGLRRLAQDFGFARQADNPRGFQPHSCSQSVCSTARPTSSAKTQHPVPTTDWPSGARRCLKVAIGKCGFEGRCCHTCLRRARHSDSLVKPLCDSVTRDWPTGFRRARVRTSPLAPFARKIVAIPPSVSTEHVARCC